MHLADWAPVAAEEHDAGDAIRDGADDEAAHQRRADAEVLALLLAPKRIANKVTTLSGRAVPMAARIEPTATRPTLSSAPSHSIALTNHSQAR